MDTKEFAQITRPQMFAKVKIIATDSKIEHTGCYFKLKYQLTDYDGKTFVTDIGYVEIDEKDLLVIFDHNCGVEISRKVPSINNKEVINKRKI